jgi:hypothetical protein
MTDHKASVKIEFSIYGVTEKMDAWINWSPDSSDCHPIDQRVVDFFRATYEKARAKYDEDVYEAQREERERQTERQERAELARLKSKYDK